WSTAVVMGAPVPPEWAKTTLTGPTPYTHHTVRTPLPYGSPIAPACETCVCTFAAVTGSGKAGTGTFSAPGETDEPVTSPCAPPVPFHSAPWRSGSRSTGARVPQMTV